METDMHRSLIIIILVFLISSISYPCTTAIVSGNFTIDGRPLLFKHRDTGFAQNKLMYFTDGKYDYIATVNSQDIAGNEVWAGYNSSGFAIMNSEAYNLNVGDTTRLRDREGFLMKQALQECGSLEDFEELLDRLPKPLGVRANFGVIDASGGAAYYETGNFGWKKFDANDTGQAPFGYLIRTNFSFSGIPDEGYGYIRYQNAENLLYQAAAESNLDHRFILQEVSRSLTHSLTGTDLKKTRPSSSFVPFEDFIPRYSSASSTVVQGIKPGEKAQKTVMWTILGFQLGAVAVPVWLNPDHALPRVLVADKSGNAPLCERALKLKEKCFTVTRGSGKRYIHISSVFNEQQTGILQMLRPVEDQILKRGAALYAELETSSERMSKIRQFYDWIDQTIESNYSQLFGL